MALPPPTTAHPIDLTTWERRDLFTLFHAFPEPFHGVCLRVDTTETRSYAKRHGCSLFLTQLHRALLAAQSIPNFCTRIVDGTVWRYDEIYGGSAVGRPNGTIGFAHYRFFPRLQDFLPAATVQMQQARDSTTLERPVAPNLIRFSTLPWFDFTSISHARSFDVDDCAPSITFGKMTEAGGRSTMPVSIHVHHGLADGLHVAEFVERFQHLLHAPDEDSLSARNG